MKYTLGLDIGIASVGWSVINEDLKRIESLGSRIFDKAENPKDGASLALPRRIARGTRRRLRRRKWRINEIKNLFVKYGFQQEGEIEKMYTNARFEKTPWELRYEALDNKISNEDLIRVLLQLAKRRGYRSNRKADLEDATKEDGKINGSISKNLALMNEKNYRTVGEMFWKDEKFSKSKRNHYGSYELSVSRAFLGDEAKIIMKKQQELGNEFITDEFINEYMEIWGMQKPFASKEQILKLIGNCTLERDEKRAAKAGATAEEFVLLQKINNIRVLGSKEREDNKLTKEEKEKIYALAKNSASVTYKQIRKELGMSENEKFKDVRYKKDADISESEKQKFIELSFRNKIRTTITKELSKDKWEEIKDNNELLDYIGTALTWYKTDEDITNYLIEKNVDKELINPLLKLSFKGVMHLSIKAMKNIIPFLREGLIYNEACNEAGYDFKGSFESNHEKFLPVISKDEVANPVVLRALTQTRKVINAVIAKYGSPFEIHIEFARDVAKNFKERQEIEKRQRENEKNNEGIIKKIKELNPEKFSDSEPRGLDILKYKLAEEQCEKCLYSLEALDMSRLFEDGYVQVDHAIPFSRSYNDSYMNKVLVLSRENQHKGNRIPYEYFEGNSEKWNNYRSYVWSLNIPIEKKEILTREKYTKEDSREWKKRNINDTRYIAVFMKNYIENCLLFDDYGEPENRKKIITLNGAITSHLRNIWGLKKVRADGDTHHAMDATVIAVCNDKNINNITRFSKHNREVIYDKGRIYNYDTETGEIVEYKGLAEKFAPQPWNGFSDELKIRMMAYTGENPNVDEDMRKLLEEYIIKYGRQDAFSDVDIKEFKAIFVSRAPKRKVTGAAHKETIYSKNVYSGSELSNISDVCVKKPVKTLKLNDLENMVGKETDMLTYNLLFERLTNFGNNPAKAFEEPIYKTKKDGTNGPEIKSIKIKSKINHGVHVNNGVAENAHIVRIDVFEKDGKTWITPIYIADTKKRELPNRVIAIHKNYEDWNILDDTYVFKFSLYPNDIIKIKRNNKELINEESKKYNDVMAYYCSTDINGCTFTIRAIDNSYSGRVSIQSAKLEKYTVDVLGNFNKVKKEKRIGF